MQRDVRIAVRSGLLEAATAGTAAVIDHHVSSGCIAGVLDVIAKRSRQAAFGPSFVTRSPIGTARRLRTPG